MQNIPGTPGNPMTPDDPIIPNPGQPGVPDPRGPQVAPEPNQQPDIQFPPDAPVEVPQPGVPARSRTALAGSDHNGAALDGQPSPPADMLADVRDGFNHLEQAVSTGRPEIARRFVGPELYEELVGNVRDLSRRNCRRVHGAFEILSAEIDGAGAAGAASGEGVPITVQAISSLAIVDTRGRLVEGSDDLMRWTQNLTAKPDESGRWLITSLGQLSVEGRVLGPAGPALKLRELTEFDKRQRESEEHSRALVHVGMSLIAWQY